MTGRKRDMTDGQDGADAEMGAVALAGWRAGKSQRQIAVDLFGGAQTGRGSTDTADGRAFPAPAAGRGGGPALRRRPSIIEGERR